MSKEEFDLKQPIFDATPTDLVKIPNIPVDKGLQEAEDLYVWSQPDKEELEKINTTWELITDLPVRTGACRHIQSQWQKEMNLQKAEKKEWDEKSDKGYHLRDELLDHFEFAYFHFPDLISSTKKIAEGSGHADMIQDLSDLAILGKANPAPLVKANIDLSQLDEAETLSEELAVLLAKVNGQRLEDNPTKILRDKAYMHMKEAVDEIRRVGHYVFRNNESRRKGYYSKYVQAKNRRAQKKRKDKE